MKKEVSMARSTYGGEERCIQGFGGETSEGDQLEGPGVKGRIVLKWIFEKWGGGHGLHRFGSQHRDRWRDVVYAVMNLRVP
jgi:hypothetical protein